MVLHQTPASGSNLVKYVGDLLELTLRCDGVHSGEAFVRTNFGGAAAMRRELIVSVEEGVPILGANWVDMPMRRREDGTFVLCLPLSEVGLFDFKGCAIGADGTREWLPGGNLRVKVEPSYSIGANMLYNAFVRQFGPNISGEGFSEDSLKAESLLNARGYTVIPPSGTFAAFREKLPFIMDDMLFRIIMFLPVHPVPATFAKMGRFGSPFAPLDFFEVDSAMAVFDRRSTPVEQFTAVLDDIHARRGLAFIDLPLDHTGWASAMQVCHPEWYQRNPDGTFESPGAWGVVWADLCKLDFRERALWQHLAEVVLHWCRIGVDGFRCDAGYMVPCEVWSYITAKVREQYPDTIFLLEGLGGPWKTTCSLLQEGGLNWAYSESFQEFGYEDESHYLTKALQTSAERGILMNFAETHDNNRLAATSEAWARHRVAEAAMFAPAGAFGIANGVEWLATAKIDVHDSPSLNWGAPHNIVPLLTDINCLLRGHPAFRATATMRQPTTMRGPVVSLLRGDGEERLLVLSNPDMERPVSVSWESAEFNPGMRPLDILGKRPIQLREYQGRLVADMPPGAVFCLSCRPFNPAEDAMNLVRHQELRACSIRLAKAYGRADDLCEEEVERMAGEMERDPYCFLSTWFAKDNYLPVVVWDVERDWRRVVMFPERHILLLKATLPFSAEIFRGGRNMVKLRANRADNGSFFAICCEGTNEHFMPGEYAEVAARLYPLDHRRPCMTRIGKLMLLPEDASVSLTLPARDITILETGLCANDFGSYTLAGAAWATLRSKYDALLALNFTEAYPDDRTIMLIRFRAWLRYRDFSHELELKCQTHFLASYDNTLEWRFDVPCGLGQVAELRALWHLARDANEGTMSFTITTLRGARSEDTGGMTLIVRPDVDCRSSHALTKAYTGPENKFRSAVRLTADGIVFAPVAERSLRLTSRRGTFHDAPEWSYMVLLPVEEERGMDGHTDVFSPGYFKFLLSPGSPAVITASTGDAATAEHPIFTTPPVEVAIPLLEALRRSMRYFVVRRNTHKSVIAGYPWFLDWGRDTLICLRGLVAAGELDDARDTICQFASFARNGTIPNMIRGGDTSDRQTSDAPLWLFVTVTDFIKKAGDDSILEMNCAGNPLFRVLCSLADALWSGAENGVAVDKDTALLFSPPHFTWMDTNYPACTPRSGFPIEIQALWLYAMRFLAEYGCPQWRERHDQAQDAFLRLFIRADGHGLADCLHAPALSPAVFARADDAVRPNQLLALTLGIVNDYAHRAGILAACAPLLTPAGIRSLDDAPVTFPLPVTDNGCLLNDPFQPFRPEYSGAEDTRRKPAYHNGTSWAWQMPLFAEALFITCGKAAIPGARSIMTSAAAVMQGGCLGFLPEIYDGAAPHHRKGCVAQAWSMTEAFRVLCLLDENGGEYKG